MSIFNESNEATTMESLCDDILIEIFSYLDFGNLKNSTLVCRNWNEVIGSTSGTMMKLQLQVREIDAIADSDFQGRQYRNVSISKISFEEAAEKLQQFDLSQVKNLVIYDNYGCTDGKDFLEFLTRMPQLKSLDVKFFDIKLHDSVMPTVQLAKLKKLQLNTAASNWLEYLSIENLLELKFSGTSVRTSKHIKRYKKLKKLELSHNAFSALLAENCGVLECQLTSLTVDIDTFGITEYDIKRQITTVKAFLKPQAPTLTTLKIQLDGRLSEEVLATFLSELRNLTFLQLLANSIFSPSDNFSFIKLKPIESLKELNFAANFWRPTTHTEFLMKFPNLETLIVDYWFDSPYRTCPPYLSRIFKRLKHIRVEVPIRVQSELKFLLSLLKNSPTFELLEISHTEMNDLEITTFAERLLQETSLKHFKLRGSTKFMR